MKVVIYHVVTETLNIFSPNTKTFIELKKFKNIQGPMVEKHNFLRTI